MDILVMLILPIRENGMCFHLFISSSISFLPYNFLSTGAVSGNVSKETQNPNLKEHKHPYVHCSVIYNN